MLLARGNAHQPVAVAHVFVRQAEFFRSEEQRDRSSRKLPGDELAAELQPPQRMLQRAMTDGGGADHQPAIGHGFGQGRIFPRFFENLVSFDRGAGFAKRDLVGIHQAQFGASEVAHGAGGRADVERIARGDQDHPQWVLMLHRGGRRRARR